MDPDWHIPYAPYSGADLTLVRDPDPTELDFAVLRLSQPLGMMNPAGEVDPRGWIDLPSDPATPRSSSPLLIVQHQRVRPEVGS